MSYTAWLIECRSLVGVSRWLRLDQFIDKKNPILIMWTNDANVALQFVNERDAVMFCQLHIAEIAVHLPFVTQHEFILESQP